MAKMKPIRNHAFVNRMETLGYNQTTLAEKAGIHRDTVRSIIKNEWHYQPHSETVWRLVYALQESPEKIGLKQFLS